MKYAFIHMRILRTTVAFTDYISNHNKNTFIHTHYTYTLCFYNYYYPKFPHVPHEPKVKTYVFFVIKDEMYYFHRKQRFHMKCTV